LKAALSDRCFVMASILQKTSTGGQFRPANPSAPRGALQLGVPIECRLTALERMVGRHALEIELLKGF
jgi:hypothetical protein